MIAWMRRNWYEITYLLIVVVGMAVLYLNRPAPARESRAAIAEVHGNSVKLDSVLVILKEMRDGKR